MKKINDVQLKQLVEAAIFVAEEPLSKERMQATVLSEFQVSAQQLNKILSEVQEDYASRGIQLHQLATGYSCRSNDALSPFLSRL